MKFRYAPWLESIRARGWDVAALVIAPEDRAKTTVP
jgi:hypothetical protein